MSPTAAAAGAVQTATTPLAGMFATWLRDAARVGRRLTTTPGRMRLALVAIVVGLLVLAVVGSGAVRARQRAAGAVGHQAEPLLVGAEVIYSSLADADATATNSFLTSGLEPPERRQAFLDDLATAANRLATVSRQAGTSTDAARALTVIDQDLPTYSGLIEAARADNRLGLPVGAAYLREGSAMMQTQILPAVGQLYRFEAGRLHRAYVSGRSALDVVGVLLAAALVIIALILGQGFLTRRTNRVINPGLLGATVLALVLVSWSVVAFTFSGSRLGEAQSSGSDPVQLLSSARLLVFRAQADENVALVARGGDRRSLLDFDAVTAELGAVDGPTGLLGRAERSVPASGRALTGPDGLYAAYMHTHLSVVGAETGGQFAKAVALATGRAAGDQLPAASELTAALGGRIDRAQTVFDAKAAAAAHDLSRLGLGVIGLIVLAGVLAFLGLQQRINEYR